MASNRKLPKMVKTLRSSKLTAPSGPKVTDPGPIGASKYEGPHLLHPAHLSTNQSCLLKVTGN